MNNDKVALNRRGIRLIALTALLHTTLCILSGALGWIFQSFWVATATAWALVFIRYRLPGINRMVSALTVTGFFLIYVPTTVALDSFWVYPIWIYGLLVALFTQLTIPNDRVWKPRGYLLAGALAGIVGGFLIMPNWLSWVDELHRKSSYNINAVKIADSSGRPVIFSQRKEKVYVLAVWNTGCGVCIRGFKDLQRLKDQMAGDSSVFVGTLHVPNLEYDNPEQLERLQRGYSFHKLFIKTDAISGDFAVPLYPLVLVYDSQMKCRFAGTLQMDWNIWINNIHNIIKNVKTG